MSLGRSDARLPGARQSWTEWVKLQGAAVRGGEKLAAEKAQTEAGEAGVVLRFVWRVFVRVGWVGGGSCRAVV